MGREAARQPVVQVVGHGELDGRVSDLRPVIRIGDWRWQQTRDGYGTRTDHIVKVDGRHTPGADWFYRPSGGYGKIGDGGVDITPHAAHFNKLHPGKWASTGTATILAAWTLYRPDEIWLYGFTALESGAHKPRVDPVIKKRVTTFHDYAKERAYLQGQGINLRFVRATECAAAS